MFSELGLWYSIKDGDMRGRDMLNRHYSGISYGDNRRPRLFCGPGEKMVLMTTDSLALFVWKKWIDPSGQQGIYCQVFHNEGPHLSSLLIAEAERLAWRRWPAERLYTYVDPRKVQSSNPGYCFQIAGWHKCGVTKRHKLLIFEKQAA